MSLQVRVGMGGERGLMENALESFQVDRWADGERSGEVFR